MLVVASLAFVISLVIGLALALYGRDRATDYRPDLPQRFHLGNTPRIGGVALIVGVFGSLLLSIYALSWWRPAIISANMVLLLLLVTLPAFLIGLFEDATQSCSVAWRLGATVLSGLLAGWLVGASVIRLDVNSVNQVLSSWPWLGFTLAVFAITGLPHAMNIIDGYNGLAGMVAVMICLAIAYVALQVGDRELAVVMCAVTGASLGFLMWNYPKGLLFAGDSGAYFWGIMISVCSVLLVQRHAQVSPWFPMLLLIYPVWETVFSIYRKIARGQSPGVADSMHFHQLVYKRVVRGVFHDNETRQMLMRNNRTSPYLWAFSGMTVAPAMIFWYSTPILMLFCGLFILTYLAAYLMIVRFKIPRWTHSTFGKAKKKPPN